MTTDALAALPTPDTFRESREVPAGRGIVAPWQRGEVREAESIPPPSASERATGQPGLQVDIAALAQTPSPTSWPGPKASTGIFPANSQIAVSRMHVVVTTNDTLSFYDKSEVLLQAIFPGSFFLSNLSPPTGDLPAGIDRYSDMRAIFDSYRNRFWTGALAFNSAHENDRSRLTKFLAAVSRTENPLDGWYLYWWDAVAHDGLSSDPVFQPGDGGDYPTLGIDSTAFYQTDGVSNVLSQQYRYWLVSFFPADQPANGTRANGWRYYDLTNQDGGRAGLIQSVVHHGQSPQPTSRAGILTTNSRSGP